LVYLKKKKVLGNPISFYYFFYDFSLKFLFTFYYFISSFPVVYFYGITEKMIIESIKVNK